MMAFGALFIATAIPLFFLYLVHTLDIYGTGSFRAISLSFLWGAVSVAFAAVLQGASSPWFPGNVLALFAAPILEEALKVLILLYLIRRPSFTYFVNGAVYGFAAGVGFAIFENYVYIGQNPDAGLSTALGRVLSTNLMHASASAMVGIALGISRFRPFAQRILYLFGGLLLATLFHIGFNHLVIWASKFLLLYAIAGGLTGFAFIAFTIKRGLAAEKRWIEEKLGAADRVTKAETTAVHHLEQIEAILAPVTELFGEKKARQIEAFLTLQARLGILRKTLEQVQDNERLRIAVEKQIEETRHEMDAARRAVGTYTMASLRMLFQGQQSPMWQRLQLALQEQALSSAAEEHPDLFTLAGARIEERRARSSEQSVGE